MARATRMRTRRLYNVLGVETTWQMEGRSTSQLTTKIFEVDEVEEEVVVCPLVSRDDSSSCSSYSSYSSHNRFLCSYHRINLDWHQHSQRTHISHTDHLPLALPQVSIMHSLLVDITNTRRLLTTTTNNNKTVITARTKDITMG